MRGVSILDHYNLAIIFLPFVLFFLNFAGTKGGIKEGVVHQKFVDKDKGAIVGVEAANKPVEGSGGIGILSGYVLLNRVHARSGQ